MKMKREQYDRLVIAIDAVVHFYGGCANLQASFQGNYRMLIWKLHAIATCNLQFSDDHPCFADHTWPRITPYVEGFRAYGRDDELNDDHIETALRRICKDYDFTIPERI